MHSSCSCVLRSWFVRKEKRMFASSFTRSCFTNKVNKPQSKKCFSTKKEGFKQSLTYKEFGHPEKVITLNEEAVKNLGKNNVRVTMKAAPINLYDIEIMKGNYRTKRGLPTVGGTEGVGIVSEVTSGSKYEVGDWVIPSKPGAFGTWCEEAIVNEKDVLKVPNTVPVEYAASLSVAPTTAYLLLQKFADLKEGDVIIQSAGNSMVGQTIAQLAALKGIKTISIIRSREPQQRGHLVERLKYYGHHLVIPDTLLNTPTYKELVSDLPAPSVAFDCVGGRTATDLARSLKEGGTLVSYGSFTKGFGLKLPTSAFIFNNIKVRGFWYEKWLNNSTEEQRLAIINELSQLVKEKKLRLWLETYALSEYPFAFPRLEEKRDRKIIFTVNPDPKEGGDNLENEGTEANIDQPNV